MAEPANLNEMHKIDRKALAQANAGLLSRGALDLEVVDPQAERIADMVANAAVAAVAAQSAKGATAASVRSAARAAVIETQGRADD